MPIGTALIDWRLLALSGLIVAAAFAWEWHGSSRYDAGVSDERVRIEKLQAAIDRGRQEEKDREDAIYRGAILARQAAQRDLSTVRGRLDRLLRDNGRDPANPRAGRRPDDSGPDWIAGFAACYAEYGDLATDAAEWADRVNGLQGYVRAVKQSPGK